MAGVTWSWHRVLLEMLLIYHLEVLGVSCLRGMRIRVPVAVRAGTPVRLACDYDLMRAPLYSIKWYRDDQEFYRFVPKEEPPGQTFTVDPPITVDITESNEHEVYLVGVQRSLSGTYKCEVTGDAPLFHTDIKSAYLAVVEVVPDDGVPRLSADRDEAPAGQPVHLVCRSPPLNVPPNITWYIQDNKVTESSPFRAEPLVLEEEPLSGLQVARSDLHLQPDFKDDTVRVRCVISVFDVYEGSADYNVRSLAPPPAPIMGPTAPLGLSDAHSSIIGGITSKTTSTASMPFIFSAFSVCYILLTVMFR